MPEPLAEQRKLLEETRQLRAVAQERIDGTKRTILVAQAFVAKKRVLTKHSVQDQKK